MKQTIKLSESQLRNIVKEAINSILPDDHPENSQINTLNDLENTLTKFVQSQISTIEDEADAREVYGNLTDGLHYFFWQLSMNGYKLVKD